MQRLFAVGILLLAGVAGSWMGAAARAPGDDPKEEKKQEEGKTVDDCATKVCPVAKLLDLGVYCIYYSIRCPNIPVALSASCATPYPKYCGACANCVDVGQPFSIKKRKDDKREVATELYQNQFTHPDLARDGIPSGTTAPDPDTVTPAGSSVTFRVHDPVLANLKLKADGAPTKVMLYVAKHLPTKPTQGPVHVFGAGLEVDTALTPEFTIPYDNIVRTNGHVRIVQWGGVNYQVILWKRVDERRK